MKNKVFLLVSILILLVSSYGFYMYNKPHREIAEAMPELFVTSNRLIVKFNENKDEISKVLIDKIIQVSGVITTIEQSNDGIVVILDEGVKCELSKLKAEGLDKGKFLMVKGIYNGFDEMFNEISLGQCYLID